MLLYFCATVDLRRWKKLEIILLREKTKGPKLRSLYRYLLKKMFNIKKLKRVTYVGFETSAKELGTAYLTTIGNWIFIQDATILIFTHRHLARRLKWNIENDIKKTLICWWHLVVKYLHRHLQWSIIKCIWCKPLHAWRLTFHHQSKISYFKSVLGKMNSDVTTWENRSLQCYKKTFVGIVTW